MNVPSDSLNPNTLTQTKATHSDLATIQRGKNLGRQVLYEPAVGSSTIADINFVHGLTGNSYDTWYHKESRVHWPCQLLKEDIPDARILSFGYDANVVGWWTAASVNRIGSHAEALLGAVTRLRERTNSENRKIIFVMHSLGGLVVQSTLALSGSSPEVHL
jgi:pimeloyl-ACP methyl ester carboxylesterase